jgi:hypothetical protein
MRVGFGCHSSYSGGESFDDFVPVNSAVVVAGTFLDGMPGFE